MEITDEYLFKVSMFNSALDMLQCDAADLRKYIRKEKQNKRYMRKIHPTYTDDEVDVHFDEVCRVWTERLKEQYEKAKERAEAAGFAMPFTFEELVTYTKSGKLCK